jgi:MGT family glycosyltransferase
MRIYNERQHLFESILQACSRGDRGLVMSVGEVTFSEGLANLPSNVLMRPYVPQLTVLDRASLFVTHAGTNSVYEALLAGVPLLMLPQGGDQPIVAEHVEALGLGTWLRAPGLEPAAAGSSQAPGLETFQAVVEWLLTDEALHARVREAGEELRRAGGLTRATELVSQCAVDLAEECA